MGNQHSGAHAATKPRKNVHWKSAGRPGCPGKPEIIPLASEEEPNSITLRWSCSRQDGGAPLLGYQVECNRLGAPEWVRTAPAVVQRPELLLTGLQPPHRYQFRVAALNAVGRSDYSELSDVLTLSSDPHYQEAPLFLQHLEDVTVLENDKTEFKVTFAASPTANIAWFKDDYEIFSSRRTAITTTDSTSVLLFHQTLASDEGEIKCTATNRAGHAVTKARLSLEAAPKLRYPRQYEDGLLYEINETIFLKTAIVGKPTPTIEWRHDGQPVVPTERLEMTNTAKFSMLKIQCAKRSDRGEYQIHAYNSIGEDTAAFLVTVTAPPEPPRRVSVTRQLDKSVSLDWEPPADDGGCRVGNYVVEYYRTGWNVWLKATTSRKTNVTLFDLIEGSEYRFRIKAESPYGMSAPSMESAPVKIPGRAVDMEFLAVESRIINEVLTKEDGAGEEKHVSPAPRRKRAHPAATTGPDPPAVSPEVAALDTPPVVKRPAQVQLRERASSTEFMLVLYPESDKSADNADKRKSFQLDLEDALSPPPISLSAPELSSRCIMPFRALRNAVSSTEMLHERAMARFYKAVAMEEEKNKLKQMQHNHIPYNNTSHDREDYESPDDQQKEINYRPPQISIKSPSVEENDYSSQLTSRQISQDSDTSFNKWQNMSFDEDYTASTVSSDEELSEDGSLTVDINRNDQYPNNEDTYNPRGKNARHSPVKERIEQEEEVSEREVTKLLPLPDPNFVPKPILKRRGSDNNDPKVISDPVMPHEEDKKPAPAPVLVEKPKKEEKMTIFKKITKMPVQRTFPFPKLLQKKDTEKTKDKSIAKDKPKPVAKTTKDEEKVSDEGRTVIEHYGNIVKEYGSQNKRPSTPLYLKTEDLKHAAEKQTENYDENKKLVKKKVISNKTGDGKQALNKSKALSNSTKPSLNAKQNKTLDKTKTPEKKKVSKLQDKRDKPDEKVTQKIVLKTTERATIVIPIDYHELEEKAKENVRSAIDYMVDLCLLILAFWVYFFKDERLAIPLLILIIYRQLQETLMLNIPEWIRTHTPSWIKKKTS